MFFRSLVKEIEQMPKIEVIVYAALSIKRCSYFYRQERLKKILKEQEIDPQRFYLALESMNLKIYKGFYIAQRDWPDYDYFHDRYKLDGICRADNGEGAFLDIPQCCAEAFAKYGDKRDREILQKHPFRGARTPEEIHLPPASNKKWWREFMEHFYAHRNSVYDYSEETRLQVEKLIEKQELPKETILLSSMYIPCKVDCKKFIAKADKMNRALKNCLSPKRYREIIRDYTNQKIYL